MTNQEQREAARQFYYRWNGKGQEDEDARSYWIEILQKIFGMKNVTERTEFEKKVIGSDGNTKRIDVYIPETRVLIEQKSLGIPLDKPQAAHNGQTPYDQAKYYDNCLPFEEKSRWIITSNFAEIWIYDMNQKTPEPVKLQLSDLQSKYHLLSFLINKETKKVTDETKVSLQAGELVGKLYDAFLKQYKEPEDPENLKSLNKLCVRIVFCLYAEDADVFPKNRFHDYMAQTDAKGARKALVELFRVLDQKPEERDEFLEDDDPLLASFPYVNGGLFADEDISIPPLTDEIMNLLLRRASVEFDWSEISPTIFGAVFESTLNPETRRSGGMHYTSLENIHKVIDPLFLDGLKQELADIQAIAVEKTRNRKLKTFQEKLASLTFLDPAAGSGNFLTETYLCLRRIENEVIDTLQAGQVVLGVDGANPIMVSINQFYGIEINDFAVTVARTALWIAESQMIKETEDIVHTNIDFLPLTSTATIVEGNALRMDWNSVIDKHNLNYIMGNPPFVGSSIMPQGSPQKMDVQHVFCEMAKNEVQDLDYVTCWYKLAAELIQGTTIECCFVSTNSICQGSQVPILWNVLFNDYKMHINFAYRTFRWNSESTSQAAVHCVIVSIAAFSHPQKKIYDGDSVEIVDNISPYLIPGDDCFVIAKKTPLSEVPKMNFGNQPRDGGFLVISKEERETILSQEPELEKWLLKYIGAVEFINNKSRWCLWLKHATPEDIKKSKLLYDKVNSVREFRLASRAKTTNGYAKVPHLFAQITQPENVDYLIIPRVSSERRRYVPIGFMSGNVIASDAVQIVPDASLYHFGVLTSNVHMAWMRTIAGRLKSDYRYSKEVVYNTFPWPVQSEEQKQKIKATAQGILDSRNNYANTSLATLYDPNTMPNDLLKAHQANDRAVMRAYGMPIKETDEAACVAWLMRLYQEKIYEIEK